jgi:hypothetical protein
MTEQKINAGEQIKPVGFENEGNRFRGWAISQAAADAGNWTVADRSVFTGSADLELWAVWAREYTVTFVWERYQGDPSPITYTQVEAELEPGEKITLALISAIISANPAFNNQFHRLLHWITPDGNRTYADGAEKELNEDTVLFAVWQPITHTVTFYCYFDDDLSPETGTVTQNQASLLSGGYPFGSHTKMSVYRFVGWSETRDGPVKYVMYPNAGDIELTPDMPLTFSLYSVWVRMQEVTFNGGSHSPHAATPLTSRQYFVADMNIFVPLLPAPAITRPNYRLAGWSLTSGGSVDFTPGQMLTLKTVGSAVFFVTEGGEEIERGTLWAVWEHLTVDLTFHWRDAGGSALMPPVSVKANQGYNFDLFEFGNPFAADFGINRILGWTDGTTVYLFSDNPIIPITNQSMDLMMIWERGFLIEFDTGGGTAFDSVTVYTAHAVTTATAMIPLYGSSD